MNKLQAEIQKLRQELSEFKDKLQVTEQTLQAIQGGEVDALVVSTETGMRIFTLQRTDYSYQLLVEQMGEGAATIDDKGLILYGNQRLSELLNCPLENLIGSNFLKFIAPHEQQSFLAILKQIKPEQIVKIELSLITLTEHQEILVQLSLRQYKIDELIVNSVVITDITQAKIKELTQLNQILNSTNITLEEAQNTIKKQEEQFRLALELTETGVWDWYLASNLIFWNASHYTLLGYQPWQQESSYELWRCRVHPDDVTETEQKLMQALANKGDYEAEFRVIWQDGTIHWLLGKGRGLYNESGQAVRMIGTLSEITERKIAELNQQFLNNLDLRLRQLNSAEAMLGEAIKRIGEYLEVERVVWHEVNVDEDMSYITQDWRRDATISSVVGSYRLSDSILPELIELYRAGQPGIVSDVATCPYTAPFTDNFAQMGIRAFFGIPCIDQGKWVAILAINARTPKNWQLQQVALLQETVKRLWSMIAEKKAIEALHQEQQKLSLFIKYAPVNVAMFDQNMCYLAVSQRWLNTYQLDSLKTVLGHSHYELLDIPENWRKLHQQGLAGIPSKCDEDHYILADGSEQWLKWEIQPWQTVIGNIGGIIIFVEDITQRKQAEIALSQAQESLNIAIEAAQMGTWSLDLTSGVSAVRSLRHDQLFGYETAQVAWGQAITRQHIIPEDQDIFDQAFVNAVKTGILDCEFRVKWRDGSIHWMAAQGRFYFDERGNPITAGGVNFEITERKQAQIALQEQLKREQLINNIAQTIRQTLNLDEILQTTVEQIRELLQADRTIILRFQADETVTIITESVNPNYPAILHSNIHDPCFVDKYVEPYRQGLVTTRSDFEADDIEPCYRELMQPFQVRANLAVPILQEDQLWGLLVVHQCAHTRQWKQSEIDLIKQLSIQVSIAIQQAELYQKTHHQLLEIQQAQQALGESEEKLKAVLEYAPAIIYLIDLASRHLLVNQRYCELLATTSEQLIGKSIYDFWPKETADIFAANNLEVIQSKQPLEIEETAFQSDGIHTYMTLKFPFYDNEGKIIAVGGISTDITDRKKYQEKIAQQADLLDVATDAIFVQDLDNKILFWNKGAERLYGWTEAEVLGQKSQDLFNLSHELSEVLETTIKQGSWQGEIEKITKNGQKIIVESHRTLVTNQLSIPQSILIVDSNITEKKQLEKQFYHAQRLESLGTLASGIAHDFNNILTPILGVSQLLSLHFPNLDERTERLLTLLNSSARRGADLVKQILLFSRRTEGDWTTLQLGYLLLELIGIIQQTFPKSITIQSEIPTRELWTIYADATQMHQVFMNLTVNARDAMPEGGILTIAAENRQLDDNEAMLNLAAKAGSYIVVTIADTGMGMTPDLLERIFDPFFTTKETGKGTGLGLATVTGIIKSHNGFIKVYSELGKGTQFKIFLPALKQDIDLIATEEVIPKGNNELILIVDDEITIQEVTKTTLENYSYRTIIANDGQEALNIYRDQQSEIKAIILDMMMPNLDGVKAIHALQEINPQVKIIATSGLITNQKLALEANVKIFLGKPYTNRQLLKAITEILDSQS